MKTSLKIALSFLVILIIVWLILFERKAIPDINWDQEYENELKDANGLWLFGEMLQLQFGKENYSELTSDYFDYLEEEEEKALLVMIRKRLEYDSTDVAQIERFVRNGGEVLFISSGLRFGTDSIYHHINYRTSTVDESYRINWHDSTSYSLYEYDRTLENKTQAHRMYFDRIDSFPDPAVQSMASFEGGEPIYKLMQLGNGQFGVHTVPELFTNVKALQASYRLNYNKTFGVFKNKKVIYQISSGLGDRDRDEENNESILKYILSQRALKYAYYLMLLFALIYLAFSSKRKQKYIKLVPPVKNTSLEYIHTTSDLFMSQNQNRKLVPHIGKVYHSIIARKYFLANSDPAYVSKLAKKSRVSEKLIMKIENVIANAENYDFTDEQLITLYNDINLFHKNSK